MFGVPLHILVTHFPIALTVIALVYDTWAIYGKRPELHKTGYGLSLWSAVFALATVVTGLQLAGVTRIDAAVMTGHAGYGIGAGILLTMLAIWRYSARARHDDRYRNGWLVLHLAATFLVWAAAITGHRF